MHSNCAEPQFPSKDGERELAVYLRVRSTEGMFAKEEGEKLV